MDRPSAVSACHQSFLRLSLLFFRPLRCNNSRFTLPSLQPWIGRQLIKLLIFSSLLLFIINQYVNPTVANSPHPLSGSVPRVMERVLKLSIPTLYVWLCMFYCFFHLWLNILAELLRFGDREFYKVNI
jgi:diacylglycerol O-acyltransferase-1